MRLSFALTALTLTFAGCSTNDSAPATLDRICEAGEVSPCSCPGDKTGVQSCIADGTAHSSCMCPADDPGDDAGGSGDPPDGGSDAGSAPPVGIAPGCALMTDLPASPSCPPPGVVNLCKDSFPVGCQPVSGTHWGTALWCCPP